MTFFWGHEKNRGPMGSLYTMGPPNLCTCLEVFVVKYTGFLVAKHLYFSHVFRGLMAGIEVFRPPGKEVTDV